MIDPRYGVFRRVMNQDWSLHMSSSRRAQGIAWLAGGTILLTTVFGTSSALAAPSTATISVTPTAFVASESVKINVDYPTASPYVGLELKGAGDTWTDISGQQHKKADKSGKYAFTYRVNEAQTVRAVSEASGALATDELPLNPVATSGVLQPIIANSTGTQATTTANFSPARSGQATELQALSIVTSNTDEVETAKWETVDTSKQDSSGKTTFDIDDPLEVTHQYRAVTEPSGGSVQTVSNTISFAAPAVGKNTGLATVYFNSNEGDSVNTRSRYFEGEFSMTGGSAQPECKTVPAVKKSEMKGRGNYSWSFSKKSFTLKLDKSTDLCGMGKSKKWALIANAYDKSLLRTSAAFNIGAKMTNLAWTPKSKPVDLYVNGSYRGSYLLVERITIAANRVAIDELKNGAEDDPTGANNQEPNISGGYVLEWDFRKGADHNVTAGSRGWVGIKEPEDEDDDSGITSQQVSYINDYLDDTDKALFGSNFGSDTSGWQKYIDIDSAVDYYIAQELMKPVDGNMWASVYMYKARNGKLFFGPMWDYDLSSGSANRTGAISPTGWYLRNKITTSAKQSDKTWFNRLNEDSEFRSAVSKRWNEVYPSLKTNDAFLGTQRSLIADSADENFGKWNVKERVSTAQVVKGSWSSEVSYLRSWLNSRVSWMNGQY